MSSAADSGPLLHLTGPIVVDAETVRREAWCLDGALTFEPPKTDASAVDIRGFVLPGLVDMHCHIGLGPHGAVPPEEAERQAFTDRSAGVLLVRDAGSALDTRWIQEREDLPRLIRAGRHIARTHRYIRNYAREIEPEQLRGAVIEAAHDGDGWVKIVADWIDRERGDLGAVWPSEALRGAVAAVHDHGARMTAHSFSEEALPDLIASGIDCIEHGTGLTEETVGAMAARDIALVPTLINIENFLEFAAQAEPKFPRYAEHMRDLHARRYDTIRAAHLAGVRIFAGTDAGGKVEHGRLPEEALELTKAGLSTVEALGAASWGARTYLGVPGLVEGASADLVVYDEDPREDVRVLASPAAIVLRGRRVSS